MPPPKAQLLTYVFDSVAVCGVACICLKIVILAFVIPSFECTNINIRLNKGKFTNRNGRQKHSALPVFADISVSFEALVCSIAPTLLPLLPAVRPNSKKGGR